MKCMGLTGRKYEKKTKDKSRISLREMRESNYWLRIIRRTVKEVNPEELDYLVSESSELKKILGSIVQKSRE